MWTVLITGLGIWLLLEGIVYAGNPEMMKRFGTWLSSLPEQSIRQIGLWLIVIAGLLLYVMLKFGTWG